jgi:quinoprotein relay system zinc metallohydrolase 2
MLQLMIGLFGLLIVTTQPHAQPLELIKAGEGIYVHHGVHEDLAEGYHGDICNISFIVGSKGIAVIDTGGTYKVGQRFREAIRTVSDLPILYVINTHMHPDHIYGNAAFAEDNPQFVGHARLADAMERRKEAYARTHQEWLGKEFAGSEIIKPSLTVNDELNLDLGDRQLKLTAYPVAHTNTDLTVIDSKSNTLWTGDLLFVERTPSIDGDIKGWISVTENLGKLSISQAVPGHGPVVGDWQTALLNQHRYLTTLLNDIRASIKKGEMMESTMDTAAISEKDRWVLFDIVNRRNVNNIYPRLEWE